MSPVIYDRLVHLAGQPLVTVFRSRYAPHRGKPGGWTYVDLAENDDERAINLWNAPACFDRELVTAEAIRQDLADAYEAGMADAKARGGVSAMYAHLGYARCSRRRSTVSSDRAVERLLKQAAQRARRLDRGRK